MVVERVECIECGASILPRTAEKYGGMCAHCGDRSEDERRERRDAAAALASGAVFDLTEEERTSARRFDEFCNPATTWQLQPEYYAGDDGVSISTVIERATGQQRGDVFLVADPELRLNLSFGEEFGVCEYWIDSEGDFLFAHTTDNIQEQVPESQHVEQSCPCCGVGMLMFPSRYHMPRSRAFTIIEAILDGQVPADVEWMQMRDISWTGRGRG